MNRSRLLLLVASILTGTAVVFVLLGAVFNVLLAAVAFPFGLAAYLIWTDITDRVAVRWVFPGERSAPFRQRATRGPRAGRSRRAREARTAGRTRRARREGGERQDRRRRRALRALGLDGGDVDESTIRAAYRERAKEVHPDADDGDEEEFKRVTEAYEQLTATESGS